MSFSAYLLDCVEGKKYGGSTLSWRVKERYLEHQNGQGSLFTSKYKPIKLLQVWEGLTSLEAMKKETEIVRDIILSEKDLDAARGGDINFPIGSRWWVTDPELAALL